MGRESYVPFVLWLTAAIVAHIAWGGGAYSVARVLEEIASVRWFATDVRTELAQAQSIEVTLDDVPGVEEEDKPQEPEEAKKDPPPKPKVEPPKPEEVKPEAPKPEEAKKPDPAKPIAIFPMPAAQPPAPPPPPPPPPMEPPKTDQRIAVKQHVENKSQDDNPTARFVGDEANKVEEESAARITSHDQDDPDPTPGTNRGGGGPDPGNSTRTRIGQSDDAPGDPDKAPGESADEHHAERKAPPAPATAKVAAAKPPEPPPPPPPAPPRAAPPPPQPVAPPAETGAQGPEAVATTGAGGFTIDPRRKKSSKPASSSLLPPGLAPSPLRLGATPNERGVRTSLAQPDVVAAVGADEISRMRASNGERRRSEHRGSWQGSTFERWRGAIENYVSSVKPGNQTALNTARVPFASYLVMIHNKLHPVFADTFLASLDSLPFDHPMNDYKIIAALEIVVDPREGRIVKMGVTKTSGITAFDVGALDAVYRSQPFGQAPPAIISSDGNVYLHWEFHRNPIYACSTMNARPYILNRPPTIEPGTPPGQPRPPADPRERGVPPPPPAGEGPARYGSREPRNRKAG